MVDITIHTGMSEITTSILVVHTLEVLQDPSLEFNHMPDQHMLLQLIACLQELFRNHRLLQKLCKKLLAQHLQEVVEVEVEVAVEDVLVHVLVHVLVQEAEDNERK